MAKMSDKELEKAYKALANRRRVAIVRYLNGHKDANLATLAEQLKLSYKSTSKHLNQLAGADILKKELRSGNLFFSLSGDLPSIARHTLSLL